MSVSVEQLTALMDFLEANPELALGRVSRSKEGRCQAKRLWEECADILNSISTDCINKNATNWRQYYNEYKCKLLKKVKARKAELSATGGGPAAELVLTPLQNRLYTILGRDVGEPLDGVRINPLESHITEQQDALFAPVPSTSAAEGEVEEIVFTLPTPLDDGLTQLSLSAPMDPLLEIRHADEPLEIPRVVEPVEVPRAEDPPAPVPPQRRRRRRQVRSQPPIEEEPSSRAEVTASLQSIERLCSEATMEQARATHRLATAIELLAEALGPRLRDILN